VRSEPHECAAYATRARTSNFPEGLTAPCYPGGKLLIRVRVVETSGRVSSGMLAVRLLRKHEPIFFASVAGHQATPYASVSQCRLVH